MIAARARRSRAAGARAAAAADEGASPHCAARLVPLDPGCYAFRLGGETGWRQTLVGFAVPAVHVCSAPASDREITILDSGGRAGAWLGGHQHTLIIEAPKGGAVLVTAHLARDPERQPLELEIRRIDALASALTLQMGDAAAAMPQGEIEVVAHVRSRGDVRFVDAPWIGRLGRGFWIEAFTIRPRDPAMAAAIEYKGLTASGAETPWLGAGSLCGTTGRAMPLVGFAVRQKTAAGGRLFDCEYSGYFQSGATAGPARNGAPCRSAAASDPLEGMQLRITPRPGRSEPAKAK